MGKDRNALAFRVPSGGRQINGRAEFGNVFATGSLLNVTAIGICKCSPIIAKWGRSREVPL